MKTALIILMRETETRVPAFIGQLAAQDEFMPVIVCREGTCCEGLPENVIIQRNEPGAAEGDMMRRALTYVRDRLPECGFVMSVISEGGYTADDILRVRKVLGYNPSALVLGTRSHNLYMKWSSRLRGTVVNRIFAIASGRNLRDVETGLRGFPRGHIDSLLKVNGVGRDYEVNTLLYAARSGMKICEAVIDTVYDPALNSYGQHLKEWMTVYSCVVKFALSSLFSFGIDLGLLLGLNHLLSSAHEVVALIISVGVARIVSCLINFYVNHYLVFYSKEHVGRAMLKFGIVQVIIMIASYILMHLMTIILNLPLAISKIISDTALFAASFVIQGKYVYKKEA